MEKERLTYIDELKGFAILMVVLGHVLSFTFGAFDTDYQSPFSTFIYGFHMPLFAFLSGLVMKSIQSFTALRKKIEKLLVPFLTIGITYSLWRGFSVTDYVMSDAKYGYWYLLFLFIAYIGVTLHSVMGRCLNKKNRLVIDVLLAAILCYAISIGGDWIPNKSIFCYTISSHLYPYIFAGYLITKHHLLDKIFSCMWLYESSFATMAACFIVIQYLHHGTALYLFRPAAVVFTVCLFYQYRQKNCNLKRILSKMGMVSLDIYVLHYFFVHSSYLHSIAPKIANTGAVFLEFLLAFILSGIICYGCIVSGKLIRTSTVMRFILFGEHN